MAAQNKDYPWMSYYGHYEFFEKRMREHSKVSSIVKVSPSRYDITCSNGKIIQVFICECYSFDVAEYTEVCQKLGKLNAIIICSNWCGYTLNVKRQCMNEQVGVYDIGGFMAALNMDCYWQYLTEDEKEEFKKNGWL